MLGRRALPALVAAAPPGIPRLSEVSVDNARRGYAACLVRGRIGVRRERVAATSRASVAYLRRRPGPLPTRGQRFRMLLTAGEFALALTLGVGTGLLVRTSSGGRPRPGIRTHERPLGRADPEQPQYRQPGAKDLFESELTSRAGSSRTSSRQESAPDPGWGGFGNSFQVPGMKDMFGRSMLSARLPRGAAPRWPPDASSPPTTPLAAALWRSSTRRQRRHGGRGRARWGRRCSTTGSHGHRRRACQCPPAGAGAASVSTCTRRRRRCRSTGRTTDWPHVGRCARYCPWSVRRRA